MLVLYLLFAFVLGRVEDTAVAPLKDDCDCSWVTIPGACDHDDGSYCWSYCCNGPSPGPSPGPGPSPSPGDWKEVVLVEEYYAGGHTGEWLDTDRLTEGGGFIRTGGMRYHSQEKLNLIGGGLKFTVDISQVKDLVNANLYLVVPGTLDSNSYFYCDNSQNYVNQGNACIELDLMESNGHSLTATTMHTKIGTNSGCDTWGCRTLTYSGTINMGAPFDIEVDVGGDGNIIVKFSQNGQSVYAFNAADGWDQSAKNAVVDAMENHGAVIVSSMWTGWVPPNTSGTGDLGGSTYKVSGLMYSGSSKGNTRR